MLWDVHGIYMLDEHCDGEEFLITRKSIDAPSRIAAIRKAIAATGTHVMETDDDELDENFFEIEIIQYSVAQELERMGMPMLPGFERVIIQESFTF